jgi:hypothetical protein
MTLCGNYFSSASTQKLITEYAVPGALAEIVIAQISGEKIACLMDAACG